MKNILGKLSLIAIISILGLAGLTLAGALDSGTKSITVGPGGSGWFRLGVSANSRVRISAKANQGRAYIKVENPRGKTVASGTNRVSFRSGKKKGKYKITLTNKTKKIQKVKVSYTASDDLFH